MQEDRDETGSGFSPGTEKGYINYEGTWTERTTETWVRLGRPAINFHPVGQPNLDILATLEGLEEIHVLNPVKDDSGLSDCAALRVLGLATGIRKQFDFTNLRNLRELNFEPDRRGPGFSNLTSLEILRCNWNGVDLSDLDKLLQLRELEINSRSLHDLSHVAHLPKLKRLSLLSVRSLTDLSPLAGCRAMEAISIDGAVRLTDLSPLAKIPTLQWIRLGQSVVVSSLAPLLELPKLRHIGFTTVLDGDVRVLTRSASLSWLGVVVDKRHHNMTRAEIDKFNDERNIMPHYWL